jgi:hypothetical protein
LTKNISNHFPATLSKCFITYMYSRGCLFDKDIERWLKKTKLIRIVFFFIYVNFDFWPNPLWYLRHVKKKYTCH